MKKMLSFLSALSLTIPTATMACSFTENVQAMSNVYNPKIDMQTGHLVAKDENDNNDIQILEIVYNEPLDDIPNVMSINNIELDFGDTKVVSDRSDAGTSYVEISQNKFYMSEFMASNGVIEFDGFANAQYSSDGIKMDIHGEIALTINGGVHVYMEAEVVAYNGGSSSNTAGKGYGYLHLEKMTVNFN